ARASLPGRGLALDRLADLPGCTPINLGTGRGYSVLEMVAAAREASGRDIPYKVVDRRPGDVAVCYADPTFAERTLGWKANRGIAEMCADHWRWQSGNPQGYRG
ncbi:MAG TPA: GDP-mannose 4,6-dehydratase, partial [Candidatus Krumholzibacteria bacterium]|nr:GDP-mannose 4,6-dehydratase [Candidatus Krumholzibacteria bacterium]